MYILGLSSREFWEMTLRMFFALVDRHTEREEMLNYRSGIIAATMANVFRDENSKAMDPMDYFIEREPEIAGTPDPDLMLEKVKLINAMFGGKVIHRHELQ